MEAGRALYPAGEVGWTHTQRPHAGGAQRHLLPAAQRLRLAGDPARLAQLEHLPPLLRPLRARRNLARDPRTFARAVPLAGRQMQRTVRGHRRFPIGEDDGKRGVHGFDAGKKVKGRKCHLVVDTLGLLMCVVVHSAGLQDHDKNAIGAVLHRLALRGWKRLKLIWADRSYEATPVLWAKMLGNWAMSIVHHQSKD